MPDKQHPESVLLAQLNLALERCGYPPIRGTEDFKPVGMGAWHDAYFVQPPGQEPLVIRLRKQVIYGKAEVWESQALHEDYAPVGLYYQEANYARPGTCPDIYTYRVDPDLVFTLESYIPGESIPLCRLEEAAAHAIGQSLGAFFRQIHARPAPLPGTGLLSWDRKEVAAESQETTDSLWESQRREAREQLQTLRAAGLDFDQESVKSRLEETIQERDQANQSIALVNHDITPENLLTFEEQWIGLVDPVPALGFGDRYAAWFVHCYRLFLPALSETPRYRRHQFGTYQAVLGAIADGYTAGYTDGDFVAREQLRMAEFLWALDLAAESLELLQGELTEEMRLRRGDEASIQAALDASLQALDDFH